MVLGLFDPTFPLDPAVADPCAAPASSPRSWPARASHRRFPSDVQSAPHRRPPQPPSLSLGGLSRPVARSSRRLPVSLALTVLPVSLLRLHFHDCFVRGCDASVLLNSTESNTAEKDAKPNKSLRGFGSVERVKAKLEAACPNTVSCADDVLTLMARDAVVLAKGPFWPVALGRRDGRVSSATEPANQLPPANGDIPKLTTIFASKGLDTKDLVVLSGGHTLGTAHCQSYAGRLYNADPSLDSEYADRLRTRCKSVNDKVTLSEMDPGSYKTFDTSYFRHVAKRRGLFQSDAALLTDATTREYVQRIAMGKFDDVFFKDFSESMIKMGNIGALTGAHGEIRKKCNIVN